MGRRRLKFMTLSLLCFAFGTCKYQSFWALRHGVLHKRRAPRLPLTSHTSDLEISERMLQYQAYTMSYSVNKWGSFGRPEMLLKSAFAFQLKTETKRDVEEETTT